MATHPVLLAENEYKIRLVTFNHEAGKHLRWLFHHPKHGNFPNDEKMLYQVMVELDKDGKLNHLRPDQRALVLPNCKKTDSRTFDMNLLCFFLLTHEKLTKTMREDIEGLKNEGNIIIHYSNINYVQFQIRWTHMETFLCRLGYDVSIVKYLKSVRLDELEQFQVSINQSNTRIGHATRQR